MVSDICNSCLLVSVSLASLLFVNSKSLFGVLIIASEFEESVWMKAYIAIPATHFVRAMPWFVTNTTALTSFVHHLPHAGIVLTSAVLSCDEHVRTDELLRSPSQNLRNSLSFFLLIPLEWDPLLLVRR